jgi:hypothetical protein
MRKAAPSAPTGATAAPAIPWPSDGATCADSRAIAPRPLRSPPCRQDLLLTRRCAMLADGAAEPVLIAGQAAADADLPSVAEAVTPPEAARRGMSNQSCRAGRRSAGFSGTELRHLRAMTGGAQLGHWGSGRRDSPRWREGPMSADVGAAPCRQAVARTTERLDSKRHQPLAPIQSLNREHSVVRCIGSRGL